MAKQFSPMFVGKTIDGIYHTSLVVYGVEYFFGGGICRGYPKVMNYTHFRQHLMGFLSKKVISVPLKSHKNCSNNIWPKSTPNSAFKHITL